MKKICIACILIFSFLFLTGCSSSKEDVKLLTEKEATNYAKEHFGKATIKKIKSKAEDKITYILTDKEYKFDYEITSYIDQFCLDGSCGDIYYDSTISDFAEQYYNYIISSSKEKVATIEKKYNVSIESDDGWNKINGSYKIKSCATQAAFYSVYNNEKNIMIDAAKELADYIKKVDNRAFFNNCSIWVRDNEKNSNDVYPRIDSVLLEQ